MKGSDANLLPLNEGETVEDFVAFLTPVIFDRDLYKKRRSSEDDIIANSAVNFYEGDIKKALQSTKVKGRIESFPLPEKYNCTVLIDYAHNAVSLESLLETLKEYQPKRIVTLFGCGGNRAAERRYEMGEVSGRLSDFMIITSDNPRFEDPLQIMKDINQHPWLES